MNIICDSQGTSEWFSCRCGCLTSSRIADAIAKPKRKTTDELQCRKDMKLDLAIERITNKPAEHFVSEWMKQGADREPLARAAYEITRDVEVQTVGFALHDSINWCGASPDGIIGDDGMIEIKCPKANTHAEYLMAECVPVEYIPQMAWQLFVTGRQWNDFVSFHPDFPEPLNLFVCRMLRDEALIAVLEQQGIEFLREVESLTARLKGGIMGTLKRSLEVL